MSESQKHARSEVGTVVSDKMQKSLVVRVERKVLHPVYKKYVKRSAKRHVHDENNTARTGDIVRIVESRPYSKTKTWNLAEILTSAASEE